MQQAIFFPTKNTIWLVNFSMKTHHLGASNEYTQHMFSQRNKKNNYLDKPSFISTMLTYLSFAFCNIQCHVLRTKLKYIKMPGEHNICHINKVNV